MVPHIGRATTIHEAITLPRFSGSGYAHRLQRRFGFEVIGRGDGHTFDATLVLAKPGRDVVVKVGTFPAGDPWPLYAAYCLQHPEPFRPTVRHLAWHGAGLSRFFVALMDRLYTPLVTFKRDSINAETPDDARRMVVATDTALRAYEALRGWYAWMQINGLDYREWHDEATTTRLVERLAAGFALVGLGECAEFIQGIGAAFPGVMIDPSTTNWLFYDNGQLVWTSPFLRSPGELPETASRLLKA